MIFAAFSTWVGWLVIAAALAAAAGVFVIRPRASHQVIPSLAVWQRVLHERRERSLWDRIRWFVSLVLALAIAAAVAVALAKPAFSTGMSSASGSPSRTLIVLDSSWSMRALTPSGGTRWERAVEGARALANGSNAGEIAVATTADGVIEGPTSDRTLIESALDHLVPSGGADGAWPRIAGATAVHFFTDGAEARAVDPEATVHSVFVPAPNVAVTAFDVEPTSGAASEAFISVANYAASAQTVRMTITRDTAVVLNRSIDVPAGTSHSEVVAVPSAGDPRFRAHVSAKDNALEIDDDAVALLWTAQPLQVAVVGGASELPALLADDPSLKVVTVDPAAYPKATADVWIFDTWLPAEAPAKPALIIDPPASTWLGPRGAEETRPAWRAGSTHQILNGVDIALVALTHAQTVTGPALQPIAVSEKETPLVSIEDTPAARFVVLGFSAESTFASTPAFPILVGNAIDWLGRPERDVRHELGPAVLPKTTSRVIAPNGQSVPLVKLADRVTASLNAPGLYLVESGEGQGVISVGLDDPHRSNLLTSSTTEDTSNALARVASSRPWWTWMALAALALVAVEWATWRRRVTV